MGMEKTVQITITASGQQLGYAVAVKIPQGHVFAGRLTQTAAAVVKDACPIV